jgi:hypothetical protein
MVAVIHPVFASLDRRPYPNKNSDRFKRIAVENQVISP